MNKLILFDGSFGEPFYCEKSYNIFRKNIGWNKSNFKSFLNYMIHQKLKWNVLFSGL